MAERSTTRPVPAIRIARMFAHVGDADEAIGWLEVACTNRESPLGRLGVFRDSTICATILGSRTGSGV